MASDYEAIRKERSLDYGRKGAYVGGRVVANLYGDRTHFIFELLQNAEDALRKCDHPTSRTVKFDLAARELRVSHFGKPFDEDDVRAICDIGEGTKTKDDVGQFGYGFKSVYQFTDRPQIHSGDEDFGIDGYVYPSAQPEIERDQDETIFIIPLRDAKENSLKVADGLRHINLDTLLFLREIDSIEWSLPSGESGTCVRQSTPKGDRVRRVTLIGEATGHDDHDQDWLVFCKPIYEKGGALAGHVEVAFRMEGDRILPATRSPLVVFFPTAVETNLGVRIQGPYVPTPSRDNVPKDNAWNQLCVEKTSELLVEGLLWLREHNMLGVEALLCLPLDEAKFGDNSMFQPLYVKIKRALLTKRLLPTFGGGYARADRVKLDRSQELRQLFDGRQLKWLYGSSSGVSWLTDGISQDRTPELRSYLMRDLGVEEVTPATVLQRLQKRFLERQSDEWMCRLYGFLKGQLALHRDAKVAPIIRLSNGKHVAAFAEGRPQAFLPGAEESGFPTVRTGSCASEDSRKFLSMIGLSEPHPVDDVIGNVLPKYHGDAGIRLSDSQYVADIERILAASRTNASDKRDELISQLRITPFVRATHTGDGAVCLASPAELYSATERLKTLFMNIRGFRMVDERYSILRRDGVRALLEECGTTRHLRPVKKEHAARNGPLSKEALAELREQSGHAGTSWQGDTIVDWELGGLEDVLEQLRDLDAEAQSTRARYIWEELVQLEERRGRAVFRAEYRWTHYGSRRQEFDSAFVRRLNDSAWIPATGSGLQRPDLVLFESLGWRDDPFMRSKVHFKPPIVDQLAEEAGFEPAMLDRLKQLGITSLAELEKLKLPDQDGTFGDRGGSKVNSVEDALGALGVPEADTPTVDDPLKEPHRPVGEGGSGLGAISGGHDRPSGGARGPGPSAGSPQQRGSDGHFHSYVAVGRDDDGDPDGLVHEVRMALEKDAIKWLLRVEPYWQTTPLNNEGFDLVQVAGDGQECTWCEVKAMTGSLHDRPATMSNAQFKYAQKHGDAYWLYVVEQAGSDNPRIVRIQDPAGKAKTFTFDKGWLDVAKVD